MLGVKLFGKILKSFKIGNMGGRNNLPQTPKSIMSLKMICNLGKRFNHRAIVLNKLKFGGNKVFVLVVLPEFVYVDSSG